MKKNSFLASLFAALAATMLSNACKVEEFSPEDSPEPILLSATIEEPSAVGTKAYIENTTEATKGVFWSADDKIIVYNEDSYEQPMRGYVFSLTSGAGTSSGNFSGTISETRPLYAIYPEPFEPIYTPNVNRHFPCTLYVNIPKTQTYVEDSFDKNAFPMIAYAETGNNLEFKNYFGLLKLQLKGTAKVKSIVITDNSSDSKINGSFKCTYSSDEFIIEHYYNGESATTLDCDDDGGVQLDPSTPTAFYISAPEGAFRTGFSVTVTDMLGNQITKSTSKNNSIEPSKITVMPPFEFNSGANCYMLPAGSSNTFTISVGKQGNSSVSITPNRVELLWESESGLISDISYSSTNASMTFEYSGAKGNALVAAITGGASTPTILWSWHIWITDPVGSNGNYMDRNLGATSNDISNSESYGCYYQWGRKDPFPSSGPINYVSSAANSVSESICQPNNFYYNEGDWLNPSNDYLWSTTTGVEGGALGKSVYDPCPTGWRVPTVDNSIPSEVASTLPKAGAIVYSDNTIQYATTNGYYWLSSGEHYDYLGRGPAYFFSSSDGSGTTASFERAYGFSVRCIKE